MTEKKQPKIEHHEMEMNHHQMDQHDMEHMDHNHMDHSSGSMDHSMHMGNFKEKFWRSLFLAVPILILSPMMGLKLPFQFTFTGSNWLVAILATILFFYGGEPFLSGAKMELKMKSPGMMTLIAMGISVAYFYSLYAFIAGLINQNSHVMDFFWELASLIIIMLLGHWIEMNSVMKASNALEKLAALLPSEVTRMIKDKSETIPLKEVKKGDRLLIKAGEKIPADGKIVKGESTIDESAITGESLQVAKKVEDSIVGGAINGSGTLEMTVEKIGAEGFLGQVMEMVKKAQQEKSKLESLSDKVAKWLFYVALVSGILTFVVWLFLEDFPYALERMVTVFVIACPHALGLAIPLVIARSTSIAANNGLLLKNRKALENGANLTHIMLDKTGTLTKGQFTFQGIEVVDADYSKEEVYRYLGALEKTSSHPLAASIMKEITEKKITPYESEEVKNISGMGLKGKVQAKPVAILNEKGMEQEAISYDSTLLEKFQAQGNTISFLVIDKKLVAIFALGDEIKESAKDFIEELKEKGITPVMLTGDNKKAAKAVADYLNIKDYYGALLPNDKEKIITEYLQKDNRVMMVGDGINDAPALAKATIGMAIGAGTDIAIDSADVVLTNSNPKDILNFLNLAKHTKRKMIQNLWWGAGYNIIAIPLAAGILAGIGFILSPAVGAILMSLSTVIVALNAMTLKL